MNDFLLYATLCGGLFVLVVGLGVALRRDPGHVKWMHGAACLAASVFFLHLYWLHDGSPYRWIWQSWIAFPGLAVSGPTIYLTFRKAVTEIAPASTSLFVPTPVLFALFTIASFLFPGAFPASPLEYFAHSRLSAPDVLLWVVIVWNAVFYALVLFEALPMFRPAALRREEGARVLFGVVIGCLLLSALILCALWIRSASLLVWSGVAIAVICCGGFLGSEREPDLFVHLTRSVRDAYRVSRLSGVDVETLERRLVRLMANEKLYREEGVTLEVVAARLEIRPDQLSELLNARLNTSFSQFVSGYRVEEAAGILVRESRANILSVAFRVGFSSKSAFNRAFQAHLRVSPREFVARHGQKPPGS